MTENQKIAMRYLINALEYLSLVKTVTAEVNAAQACIETALHALQEKK